MTCQTGKKIRHRNGTCTSGYVVVALTGTIYLVYYCCTRSRRSSAAFLDGWRHHSVLSWPCNAGAEVIVMTICVTSRCCHGHIVLHDYVLVLVGTISYESIYEAVLFSNQRSSGSSLQATACSTQAVQTPSYVASHLPVGPCAQPPSPPCSSWRTRAWRGRCG